MYLLFSYFLSSSFLYPFFLPSFLIPIHSLTAATQAVTHDAAGRVQEAIYYYELSVELLQGKRMIERVGGGEKGRGRVSRESIEGEIRGGEVRE